MLLVVALIIVEMPKLDVGRRIEPPTNQISSANIPERLAEPFELPEHTHPTASDFFDENNFEPMTSMASAVVRLTTQIDNFFRPRTRQVVRSFVIGPPTREVFRGVSYRSRRV
jgi:hypothetical protein